MFCRGCEYDLSGLDAGRCPECGRAFDPADPATVGDEPTCAMRLLRHAFAWCTIAAVGVVGWSVVQTATPLFMGLLAVTIGALGVIGTEAGLAVRRRTPSVRWTLLAIAPALAMLGLAVSLALHMHGRLGGWPTSIGMRGFPPLLRGHADLALGSFGVLLLVAILLLPPALLACGLVRRWRGAIFYLGAFATSFVVCVAALLLAPAPFLSWWWD